MTHVAAVSTTAPRIDATVRRIPTAPLTMPAMARPRPVTLRRADRPMNLPYAHPAQPQRRQPQQPGQHRERPGHHGAPPRPRPEDAEAGTTRLTSTEATPATRLAVAGPLIVGATPTIATPNGVPATGSTATGIGSPTADRSAGRGPRGYPYPP